MAKSLAFLKEVIPWYDSTALCGGVFLCMACVLAFGIVGVRTGWEAPGSRVDAWVPGLLIALSGAVMLSLALRIGRRLADSRKSGL